jgi:hypothetical protein
MNDSQAKVDHSMAFAGEVAALRSATSSTALVIWLLAAVVAALSCSLYYPAAHLGDEYLPVGNDSFYHARRILDTVRDPGAFYEFDPKIHAPEGSLLVWPWAYDYLMAQIVRLGLAVGLGPDPMSILIWIPVAAVLISTGLLVLVGRRLSLSTWPLALTAACMALAPTTQFLHGTGLIDHHYAELIFVLAVLATGLKWFRQPDNVATAATLGAILGSAPAIHNGLFILQLPLLITFLIRWLQGMSPPRKPTLVFAAVMLGATLLISIPSTSFRDGRFEFYTLSWFHAYIAFSTGAVCVALSRLRHSLRSCAIVGLLALVLALPVFGQLEIARSFVVGSAKWLETIAEMKSPLREAGTADGAQIIGRIYSFLIWIAPVTLLLALFGCWRERRSDRLLFWVSSVIGLALLSAQLRMHYFGDFALYLPWLIVADDLARAKPQRAKTIFLVATLALSFLYTPALRQLVAPVPTTNDHTFKDTHSMYLKLRDACAAEPGIVLADNNAGHYIRYYTDCSVIVDNFLLTPLHFRKMDEYEHLFSLSAAQLVHAQPEVQYVLVRPLDIKRAEDPAKGYKYWMFLPGTSRLLNDLLLGPIAQVPPDYELLDEISFTGAANDRILYARLYKIRRAATPASSNDGSE